MGKTFTFRLTQQGVDQVERDLLKLGDAGKRVFDGLKNAAPGLAQGLNVAAASTARAKVELEKLSTVATGGGNVVSGRFGRQIQQAGYQVGDFAVQLASGQNAMVAFTQQGSQLLQAFGGPWGAVFGAAVSIVGALAVGMFKFASSAEKAKEEQDKLNDSLKRASALMDEINGKAGRTRASLEAERQNLVGVARLALENAEAQLARTPERRGAGKSGAAVTDEFLAQTETVKRLREEYTLLAATLGEFDDGRVKMGQKSELAINNVAKAQAEVLKGLDQELTLAKATARERFILQEIAEKTAKLEGATSEQVKALTADIRDKAGAIYDAREAQEAATRASADDSRERERQAKTTEAATDALNQQIAGLADERAQLKLSERERYIHNELLKAESQIRKGNIKDAAAYLKQIRDEAGDLFDATQLKNAADKARDDQKRETDRATKERERELERAADKQAEILKRPFVDAMGDVKDIIGDAFSAIWSREEVRLSDFAGRIGSIFLRLAGRLAEIKFLQPLEASFLGSVGGGNAGGTSASVGGIGSGASFGGAPSGGGFSLGSLFPGNIFQGGGTGIGTMLFGSPAGMAAGAGGPSGVIASTAGLFGSGGGGGFGTFLNTPLGGGLAGAGIGLVGSLLSGQEIVPSLITAGFTGLGTAIGGPIGGALGGLVGGLVGKLFGKKKPKLKKNEAEAWLETGAFGMPVIDYTDTDGKVPGGMGGELGKAARDAVTEALAAAGATLDDDTRLRLSYYHSTKGGKTKSEFYKATMFANLAGQGLNNISGEIDRYASVDDALQALSAGALFASGLQGNIAGTGASTQAAFKYLYTGGGKTKGSMANVSTDVAAVMEVIDFTKWIDGFDKVRTESDAAQKAVNDFNASMAKFSAQADELGIGLDKVTEAMRRDFSGSIADELLQLTDPEKFALRELEKEYSGRKAVAEKLGIDLVELEQLYALKRQAILDQGLAGLSSSWKDFINGLQFGGASALSPADQLEQARQQYEASKAVGGKTFQDAAATYLGLKKDSVGSTEGYATLFAEVIALAKQFGNLANVPGFAAGGDHAGGWRMVGEKGVEIEATGPARYFNARQTAGILRDLNTSTGRNDKPLPAWLGGVGRGDGAGGDGVGAANQNSGPMIGAHLAGFGAAIDRLTAAQDRNNREQRLTRELLRAK